MDNVNRLPMKGKVHMRLEQPDLRRRTKQASLHGLKVYGMLPASDEARIIGRRMIRHLTRVGAYYRAAIRCRRIRGYMKRLDAALYDLDIAAYWLDLLIEAGYTPKAQLLSLLTEVHELMAIMVSCRKAAKKVGNRMTPLSSN
ncbi:MAG: four helix bundle protein [Gemmatales bacterium]